MNQPLSTPQFWVNACTVSENSFKTLHLTSFGNWIREQWNFDSSSPFVTFFNLFQPLLLMQLGIQTYPFTNQLIWSLSTLLRLIARSSVSLDRLTASSTSSGALKWSAQPKTSKRISHLRITLLSKSFRSRLPIPTSNQVLSQHPSHFPFPCYRTTKFGGHPISHRHNLCLN